MYQPYRRYLKKEKYKGCRKQLIIANKLIVLQVNSETQLCNWKVPLA